MDMEVKDEDRYKSVYKTIISKEAVLLITQDKENVVRMGILIQPGYTGKTENYRRGRIEYFQGQL